MKKRLLAGMVLLTLVCLYTQPLFGQETEAAVDSTNALRYTVTASVGDIPTALKDNRPESVWNGRAGAKLRIKSETPIGGLYILWNSKPPAWSLYTRGEGQTETALLAHGGTQGFLHEYQTLTANSREVELRLEQKGTIAELYVLPTGTPPDWVQRWKPPYEKADMLLVSTHADDEHLWFWGHCLFMPANARCACRWLI